MFNCLFWADCPFELRIVANENYMEKAWPVDAFDARHFNICRGAGTGDPGDERGWLLERGEVLGQGFHNLAGLEDAEVPIGQQGEHAAAFSGGMVEDDGSGIGDAARGRRDHAFGMLDLVEYLPARGRSSIRIR